MNIAKPFTKKRSQRSILGSASGDNNANDKDCVDLNELLQFEAARQRALSQVPPEKHTNPLNEFVPHRIFINHIDTFNGSHLAKYLFEVTMDMGESYQGEMEPTKHSDILDSEEKFEQFFGESDELGEDEVEGKYSREQRPRCPYEIVGSLEFINNPKYSRPEGITELLDNEKKAEFLEKLLTCGYIIYDITSDLNCHPKQIEEAKWVVESIAKRLEEMEKYNPKPFLKYKDCRTFILISTLMTWAKTKPIDPEDPSLPFTERDYRKRKPHPNYKIHCELEKRVIELGKKYPKNLRTIVIGSGIPYGHDEDVLHFYFKMAWSDAPHLPIFGNGTNILPVVHIDSLSSTVHSVIESFPEKYKYLIITDPHSVTLKQIVKLLAKHLGNGKTKKVSKEEAFLYEEVKQRNYDMLTVNLNIVPGYIMNNMAIRWGSELPFTENISKLISEYKIARGLLPIKVFIHGPPASGKSFLARRLSHYYDIPHLHVKGVIDGAIQTLKEKIESLQEKQRQAEEGENDKKEKFDIEGDEAVEDEEEEEEEEGDDEDEEMDLETLKRTLKEIEDNMDNEKRRLDEEYVLRFFKEKLSSNSCQNKGYIIDGYPKTMEHTKSLYEPVTSEEERMGEMEEDDVQGSVSHLCNTKIMPVYVESLDASDEFLINRVIELPEVDVQNTHYEEADMCRRLTEFRAFNTEDNTPLIFYDELDVHPMIYNVENDLDPNMEGTFQAIIHHIGPPRNYGMDGLNEISDSRRNAEKKQMEELKKQKDEIKRAAQERRDNMEKWFFLKNQELEMEEKALLVMGMPLRHYLMKYIFPTLTRGLVEVARLRPEDPVEFLSEFLFQQNPEGKMFQPDYEERSMRLSQAIHEYEISRLSTRRSVDSGTRKTFSTERSPQSDAVSKVSKWKCSLTSGTPSKKSAQTDRSKSTKSSIRSESIKSETSKQTVCTCQKSPSLSTCSSDVTPPTPSSCTCGGPDQDDESSSCTQEEEEDEGKEKPCKCPCVQDEN